MQKLSKAIFIFSSLSLLIFISGFLGFAHILPYKALLVNLNQTAETLDELVHKKPYLIKARKYDRQGANILSEKELQGKGLTALQGWFSEGAKVKLIDYQGKEIHSWDLNFFRIWPHPTHFERPEHIPQTKYNFHSQGMYIYPDGDLLANFGRIGLAKMDRCGKIEWTVDRFTHHSVTVDSQGYIWVPAESRMSDVTDDILYRENRHAVLSVTEKPTYNNLILQISPDGKVLKEFSVLEKLIKAGVEDRILDSFYINPVDPVHLNDVDIVNKALAAKIPGISAGDLLVSLRQMHAILIMSRETGDILWYKIGPWVRQHDPDADDDGTISIYNNRSIGLVRKHEKPYSNILKYDPATNEVSFLYPPDGHGLENNQLFFSDIMGTHQLLPNHHLLITESRAGRVFEVDKVGNLVWEYIGRYKDKYAILLEAAERYPDDYFTVSNWSCEK